MGYENPHVSRILESLLTVFINQNKGLINNTNSQKLNSEEKRIKKFMKHSIKAVKKNGLMLQCFSEEYRIPDLCYLAVKKNGNALKYVPENYRSAIVCLKAIQKNPEAIQFVPEELKSICQTQIELKKFNNSRLNFLRRTYQRIKNRLYPELSKNTERLVDIIDILQKRAGTPSRAINENRIIENFRKLPEEMKSFDLCKKIVNYTKRAIPYIPKNFLTSEICKEAVAKNHQALQYFPEYQKDIPTCLIAYLKNKKAIEYIPKHLKNEIIQKSMQFEKVKNEIKSHKDLKNFTQQWADILDFVLPSDFIKEKMQAIDLQSTVSSSDHTSQEEINAKIKNNIHQHLNNEGVTQEILRPQLQQHL